ncbi:MAG: barstar family protein [Clostridia bacterium]|nr:barstar family protein [Clostridia bacterium]
MKKIIVNFSNCKFIGEVHKVLKEAFSFPEYYGENLSALWDCLRYYSLDPISVEVIGLSEISEELSDYMNEIFQIFDEVHEENPGIIFQYIN